MNEMIINGLVGGFRANFLEDELEIYSFWGIDKFVVRYADINSMYVNGNCFVNIKTRHGISYIPLFWYKQRSRKEIVGRLIDAAPHASKDDTILKLAKGMNPWLGR